MYIQKFQDITKEDIVTAGGKGANLGEMVRAGIPVPPGGVLTVAAYEYFMEENKISVTGQPAQVREAIREGQIPEKVKEEVLTFYHSLGENVRVAVRSSATAEDLNDASFAGQQETYLNVQGDIMLLDCIKACYASLWGDRAVSYRREKHYDGQPVALAVVIQLMVESQVAGVLFTKNPTTGNAEEVLLNASYGLGESVVSGSVSPDELVCSTEGEIRKQVIGSKETMVVYGERQTVTVPVPAEDRARLSVTPSQVQALVKLGKKIEAHYGKPMDIEWAIVENKLYILQARAITTGDAEKIEENLMPPVRAVNQKMRESLLFMMEKEPMSYYPLDYDFSMVLGRQKSVIFAEAGINVDNDCSIDENGFMMLPTVKFSIGKNVFHLPAMLKAMKNHAENSRKANESLKQTKEELAELTQKDLATATLEDCLNLLTELHRLITESAYARFLYAVFPGFMMNRKLQKYLGKVDETLTAYNLLSGLSYKTADMNRDMAALAEKIQKDAKIEEAVLSGKGYEEIIAQFPQTESWFEAFLQSYGNKSDFNCYCFVAKTWNEDKERFLQVLRPLLNAEKGRKMSLEDGKAYHQELLQKMTRGLSGKEAADLLQQINYYREYHAYREETQYLWETMFYFCRKVLRRAAYLFDVEEQELWCLFWKELQEAMRRGKLTQEEWDTIKRRKQLRPTVEEYWRRQQWEALKGDGMTIKGISGSAGEAMGKVCVVTSPAEFDKLKQGDILVCRYTDPEWTPLFTLAAGVVSDTGGALSHAAIVAREYHIPAVLATGCATASLQDGEKVFVNGTTGEVRRLA